MSNILESTLRVGNPLNEHILPQSVCVLLRDFFMEEIWIPVKGYENRYKVSNKGNVLSIKRNKVLSLIKNSAGYYSVKLYDGLGISNRKNVLVHRLVASHFIGKSKLMVNHKDSNKVNNSLDNLEFINNRENVAHYNRSKGHTTGAHKYMNKWKSVIVYNKVSYYLGIFETKESASEAYHKEKSLIESGNYTPKKKRDKNV